MLCQDYAKKPYFPHLSDTTEILSWINRKHRLLDEFLSYHADIICLQEVDRYGDHWRERLLKNGYESTYTQRTGGKPDGCATFWKSEKFETRQITKNSELETHEKCDLNGNVVTSSNSISKFLTNNVANLTLLKHRSSEKLVCVVNLHLFWDPSFPEVKLCQIFYTMKQTKDYLTSLSLEDIQIFFCGDYNSMPDSEVYEFLTKDSISLVECENDDGEKTFKHQITNPFGTATSLYKAVCGDEPTFTNYTKNFKGCLDYVMACNYPTSGEEKGILVSRALQILTEEQASEFEALPSIKNASDHISHAFDFDIMKL
ncbi:predicted protein [Naegleria gruberi]|uniref:Predicted protein n=1 Tax=Naegleria gruberi TaxID=5762 RepID=D2VCK8_NAEGR|nr:uncharacterized protein NAEGRDRAFT_32975 [Naegleria gruberi]EFC45329.1 predicted protein [Naegleria gruberi]|eukprot:XP_002678073.1 predicted protein [Naegleria gruberi strain NEG-M]